MIITIHKADNPKPQLYSYTENNSKVVIGRNPKVQEAEETIIVQIPSASRTHLAIKLKKGKEIFVKDLESSNGTKINGQKISPNQWILLKKGDIINLGQSDDKIEIRLRNTKQKQGQNSSSNEKSSSKSRSRDKNKKKNFEDLCKQLKISESSVKMLKQMSSQRKSKQEKIKFLKLMGCKNIQQNWIYIEQAMKNQNKYNNPSKQANEQLQKQFQSSRATFEKKGLGKR